MELNKEQRVRYSRTLMLPEIGEDGQKKLLSGSALVVGAGALGSICAMYLAASGVGRVGIADFDTVGLSNLQRQLSYTEDSLGRFKVDVLAERLRSINSDIKVESYNKLLSADNIKDIIDGYDVIVEGSDNPNTKYLVTDVARELGKSCILGGVRNFTGQIMALTSTGTTYRELFPDAPCGRGYTPCSTGGVFGPLPGIIASMQASEVIKLLSGVVLDKGFLLEVDVLGMSINKFEID